MFSECRTQSTVSWKKAPNPRCKRLPIFYDTALFLRQFWTAHKNDCLPNGRSGRITQARVLHLKAKAKSKRLSAPAALGIKSKTDSPLLILPQPRAQNLHVPPIHADPSRKLLASQAPKGAEKNNYGSRSERSLLGPFPFDEKLAQRASRPLSNSRFAKWANKKEDQRSLTAKLQYKSSWSHDWRISLNLLKKHYKATSVPRKDEEERFLAMRAARATANALAHAIPEPEHWTKATFDNYVYELAQFVPPTPPVTKALKLRKQGVGPHTVFEIGQTLCRVFGRKELRQFFEPENWNAAIEFLTKHAMLPQARSILFSMEEISMTIPASTFNIFMRAAAHQKDLHTFSLLLTTMIRRGISPDADTWFIFILCVDSVIAKRLIVADMAQMGILNTPNVMKKVVMATAQDDMIEFLAEKRDPKDFLYRMRLNHGPDWLAHRTGNTILNQVCKRVSLAAGLDLVEAMKLHGFTPSRLTFRTLFFQALTEVRSPLPLALYVLETYARRNVIHFDVEVWNKLFLCAWDHGYLNVIRVVWVAACLDGRVTHKMLRTIRYSFRLSTGHDGPQIDEPDKSIRASLQHQQQPPPFGSLMGHFILGFDPTAHVSLYDFRLAERRYVRMAQTAKLHHALSYNLREAYRMDIDWLRGRGRDLNEKLARRFPILLDAYDIRARTHKVSSASLGL